MSDLIKLIQEADAAAIEFEKARTFVEIAKQNLESAKEAHEHARSFLDEIVSRADDLGVPRAKIKKLIEERTQALIASGLFPTSNEVRASTSKPPRASKKAKVTDIEKEVFVNPPEAENPLMELN